MVEGSNFVFIHAPKTGGHAVSVALGGRTPGALHAPRRSISARGRMTFGFVRNPWDRAVSMYAYLCQKRMPSHLQEYQRRIKCVGFKKYILDEERWLPPEPNRPQMYWLAGCDRIGRFERIGSDFEKICREFGIVAAPLQHLNRSDRGDYRDYYDEETRAVVAERFRPEIELFGYRF